MMRFFNPDSRVMCALSRLADLMLLNLAALVCSLPVLTIGASAAALFAAVRDLINERGGSILRAYLVHWRREARRATPLFLPFLLPFAVILFDLLLLYQHPSAALLDRGLLAASAVAFLGVYLGSLQMFAHFDDSIRRTWLNGAKLFIARLPHMLLAMALLLLPFVLLLLSPDTFFRLFIVFLLLGVSGPVFALQLMLRAVMKTISASAGRGE